MQFKLRSLSANSVQMHVPGPVVYSSRFPHPDHNFSGLFQGSYSDYENEISSSSIELPAAFLYSKAMTFGPVIKELQEP